MANIKIQARKYHKVLGLIFALPLIWAVSTASLAVIIEKFFHNKALADYVLKFHTLEIVGLDDVYPFVFLIGVFGLITTALIMMQKNKISPKP